jgi:hypothetical protein
MTTQSISAIIVVCFHLLLKNLSSTTLCKDCQLLDIRNEILDVLGKNCGVT